MKFENNKRVRQAYQAYLKSNYAVLSQCYEKPSEDKYDIYDSWVSKILEDFGINAVLSLKVISFNIYMFTLGFTFKYNDNNVFCYITKDRITYMLID